MTDDETIGAYNSRIGQRAFLRVALYGCKLHVHSIPNWQVSRSYFATVAEYATCASPLKLCALIYYLLALSCASSLTETSTTIFTGFSFPKLWSMHYPPIHPSVATPHSFVRLASETRQKSGDLSQVHCSNWSYIVYIVSFIVDGLQHFPTWLLQLWVEPTLWVRELWCYRYGNTLSVYTQKEFRSQAYLWSQFNRDVLYDCTTTATNADSTIERGYMLIRN